MVAARNRIAAGLAFLAACATASAPPSTPHPLLGQPAPSFSRTTVQGGSFATDGADGRVMVVELFARWCIPCQQRLPAVEKLRRELEGVIFVGISLDERREDALAQVRLYHLGFPVILDVGRVLAGRFRVIEIPAVLIVGRDGKIAWFGGPDQPDGALRRAAITATKSESR